jgi:hypothetical protein
MKHIPLTLASRSGRMEDPAGDVRRLQRMGSRPSRPVAASVVYQISEASRTSEVWQSRTRERHRPQPGDALNQF